MRPFFITFSLAAAVAAFLCWQQRDAIASLRRELTTATVPSAKTPAPTAAQTAKPKRKRDTATVLRRADGSVVVTSRSMFRGMLEAMDYFRHLSRAEVEALLNAGIEDGDDLTGSYTAMALARLAEFDPAAALKRAGALARTQNDSSAFSLIMHDWLIRDRAAALKWFHAQPDTNAKAGFMGVAGMVLGASDPELLNQLSGNFEDPDIHADALKQSIMSQGLNDPRAALARLQELPDDDSRAELLFSLTMSGGDKIPREMLEASLPYAKDHAMLRASTAGLVSKMALEDPKAALHWLSQRTQQELELFSNSASPAFIQNFGSLETAEVRAAAAPLPLAQRDWLLASHYAGRPFDDPAALLAEASAAVSGDAMRTLMQQRLLRRASREGHTAALEPWLNSLPSQEQAALRTALTEKQKEKL